MKCLLAVLVSLLLSMPEANAQQPPPRFPPAGGLIIGAIIGGAFWVAEYFLLSHMFKANAPPCPLGPPAVNYDFAGNWTTNTGGITHLAAANLSCVQCAQHQNYSFSLTGNAGHCDQSSNTVWSYDTSCRTFNINQSLGAAAAAVFSCEGAGGSGQYCGPPGCF